MATCKDCVGYNFCSRKRDGETDYLGKEIGCGNVEDLCDDFKNKADVVPVVRCEDCKSYNGHRYCHYHADPVDDNDYCSYGERKE